LDRVARSELRTRSDLIREALREYLHPEKQLRRPIDDQRVRDAFETLRSLSWKGKFDSTEIIRKMRDSRYSEFKIQKQDSE
jgi:Arc/MetJ-type ribon-helix-helix transcriptional regulator